jgi:hypothetical protein
MQDKRLYDVRKEDIMVKTRPIARTRNRLLGIVIGFATAVGMMVVPAGIASASAAPTTTAATATACPTVNWGSTAKTSSRTTTRSIIAVRAGRQPCFDRLVIDLGAGPSTVGYDVRYVGAVYAEGSGAKVPVAGGAVIQVIVRAPAYNPTTGKTTYAPADPRHAAPVGGFTTFRQVAYAGSFEGQTTFALGVRARLPIRVFVLAGPGTGQRLVIDVAHRW